MESAGWDRGIKVMWMKGNPGSGTKDKNAYWKPSRWSHRGFTLEGVGKMQAWNEGESLIKHRRGPKAKGRIGQIPDPLE